MNRRFPTPKPGLLTSQRVRFTDWDTLVCPASWSGPSLYMFRGLVKTQEQELGCQFSVLLLCYKLLGSLSHGWVLHFSNTCIKAKAGWKGVLKSLHDKFAFKVC